MLTIKNYTKAIGKGIGINSWEVYDVREFPNGYEFIVWDRISESGFILLSRNPSRLANGDLIYSLKLDSKSTPHYINRNHLWSMYDLLLGLGLVICNEKGIC